MVAKEAQCQDSSVHFQHGSSLVTMIFFDLCAVARATDRLPTSVKAPSLKAYMVEERVRNAPFTITAPRPATTPLS